MSVGAGLIEGTDVVDLVSIRPDSIIYVNHSGAVFTEQDESGNGNVAFYEIQNQGDKIDFNISRYIRDYERPVLSFHTIFGTTDFDVVDRRQSRTIMSELSGYDTDTWLVDVTNASPEFRLTNFDDTQAAFYPYVSVFDKVV